MTMVGIRAGCKQKLALSIFRCILQGGGPLKKTEIIIQAINNILMAIGNSLALCFLNLSKRHRTTFADRLPSMQKRLAPTMHISTKILKFIY